MMDPEFTNIVFFTHIKALNSLHVKSLREYGDLQEQFICFIDNANFWWINTVPGDVIDATSCGKNLLDYDDREVLNIYTRNRYLMISKTLQKGDVFLGDEYSYAFVRRYLEKKIEKGNFVKRRLETIAITKLIYTIISCSEFDHDIERYNKQTICQSDAKLSSDTKQYTGKPCEPLSPRAPHSTIKVEASRLEIIAYPLPNANHSNGLRREFSEITQLSIPATDEGTSLTSFVPNALPKYKSILVNKNATVREPDSRRNNLVTNQHNAYGTRLQQQRYRGELTTDNARATSNSNNLPQCNVERQQNTRPTANVTNATLAKPPRHPDYADRNDRFMSFGAYSWPLSGKPDLASLVNWGFFATGIHDLVRCFQCGIGLKDWSSDDDVMTEHVKHSSECPFLLEQLGPEQLLRLRTAILYPDLDLDQSDDNRETTNSSAVRLPYAIRHPRYQTMESRVASFRNFPAHVTQPHQQLAIAGFYYTGTNDIVRCFTCDGGLQKWTPGDDAIIEHAKYFPTCSYIQQLKGEDFVQSVQLAMKSTENEGAAATSQNSSSQSQTTTGANGNALDVYHTESCSYQTENLSLNAGAANTNTQSTDPLRTPEVRSILDMGYTKDVVQKAIQELEKQGKKNCSSDEIINEILDNETRWNNTSPEQFQNNQDINSDTDPSDVAAENKRLKSLIRCMLCLTGETDILCLPCTHHRMCHECAKDVTHCPMCGKRIQDKIRTYMA